MTLQYQIICFNDQRIELDFNINKSKIIRISPAEVKYELHKSFRIKRSRSAFFKWKYIGNNHYHFKQFDLYKTM